MAEKMAAFGTELQIGDGAGTEVFTTIPGVRSIGGPGSTFDTVDVTAHDSTGAFEEVVPTIRRTEDMAVEVVFDPADTQIAALKADHDARIKRNFKVILPDSASTTYDFAAYVIGYVPDEPHDGALILNVTLKPTGAITVS